MSTHTPQKHYAKAAAQVVQNYVKAQEETTPPDQVILLLLDGVLRFIEEAKSHIDKEEFKEKNLVLVKAQTIVKELMDALDPSIGEMAFRNQRSQRRENPRRGRRSVERSSRDVGRDGGRISQAAQRCCGVGEGSLQGVRRTTGADCQSERGMLTMTRRMERGLWGATW